MSSTRVWHISGANTGLGLELALKAVNEGDRVIAAVRNTTKVPDSLKKDNIKVLQFDLAWNQAEMDAYARTAFNAFGKIDVLVNNAGYAYMGAIEETEDDAVKAQFDANVFGMLRIIRSSLPHFRAQGSGLILNLSSVGGFRAGFPSNGIYCATKFAVEAITQTLAAEIRPFGIEAAVIEPGYFRTSFLANQAAAGSNLAKPMDVYEGTPAHESRANFARYNGRQPGNPELGAARMWEFGAGKGMFEGRERLGRLPLGSDCGAAMKAVGEDYVRTASLYEDVWKSTDFQE